MFSSWQAGTRRLHRPNQAEKAKKGLLSPKPRWGFGDLLIRGFLPFKTTEKANLNKKPRRSKRLFLGMVFLCPGTSLPGGVGPLSRRHLYSHITYLPKIDDIKNDCYIREFKTKLVRALVFKLVVYQKSKILYPLDNRFPWVYLLLNNSYRENNFLLYSLLPHH